MEGSGPNLSAPLEEFLVFGENRQINSQTCSQTTENASFTWTRSNTLILLDLYKKYRSKVGTLEIRNFEKMWEVICNEFKWRYNILVSPNNCENRWRVLERNFKKYVDNKNQMGAGKKFFEFAEEMEDILCKKKNVNPTVVLSTSTVTQIPSQKREYAATEVEEPVAECLKQIESEETPNEANENQNPKTKKPKLEPKKQHVRRQKNKNSEILEKIRLQKEERRKKRLEFEKSKFEKYRAGAEKTRSKRDTEQFVTREL